MSRRPNDQKIAAAVAIASIIATVAILYNKSPSERATANAAETERFNPSLPAFVKKDRVVCPSYAVLDAYIEGHQDSGEAEGHRRVVDLFLHPRNGCYRTFSREQVTLIGEFSTSNLVDVRPRFGSNGLTDKFMVLPGDLEN